MVLNFQVRIYSSSNVSNIVNLALPKSAGRIPAGGVGGSSLVGLGRVPILDQLGQAILVVIKLEAEIFVGRVVHFF